jgi:hypothetical protein
VKFLTFQSDVLPCVFSGFCRRTKETFPLLGFYAVWICSFLPKFWDFLRENFTSEDGTDRLSRNVANQSTLHKVSNVLLSFSMVKWTSSWNLLDPLATLRMNATGLSESSVTSNPMTQLHMLGRRESSVRAMRKENPLYSLDVTR